MKAAKNSSHIKKSLQSRSTTKKLERSTTSQSDIKVSMIDLNKNRLTTPTKRAIIVDIQQQNSSGILNLKQSTTPKTLLQASDQQINNPFMETSGSFSQSRNSFVYQGRSLTPSNTKVDDNGKKIKPKEYTLSISPVKKKIDQESKKRASIMKINILDNLARKYQQIYGVTQEEDYKSKTPRTYRRNQSQIGIFDDVSKSRIDDQSHRDRQIIQVIHQNCRSKSPSCVFLNANEESPFKNTSRINTFDYKIKVAVAKKHSKSPFSRVTFPNDDKGHQKLESYKNSARNYHISPNFKSFVNLNHEQQTELSGEGGYHRRSQSPFKPEDKIGVVFSQENSKNWLKNSAAQQNMKNLNQHKLVSASYQ
ncbi:UNKNOWN [Stylonychia lemnae]|uniref:Uncharacterized protein n=1 Tax=Stylonychia lemnae TaxID=5949 RepID=A0A078AJ01_STYLE|nr:UNKNOWN [Stylonychia lemnae]|eukprot:CDW80783.1 UNKNOWN [Stylonychia lemnae]